MKAKNNLAMSVRETVVLYWQSMGKPCEVIDLITVEQSDSCVIVLTAAVQSGGMAESVNELN